MVRDAQLCCGLHAAVFYPDSYRGLDKTLLRVDHNDNHYNWAFTLEHWWGNEDCWGLLNEARRVTTGESN